MLSNFPTSRKPGKSLSRAALVEGTTCTIKCHDNFVVNVKRKRLSEVYGKITREIHFTCEKGRWAIGVDAGGVQPVD